MRSELLSRRTAPLGLLALGVLGALLLIATRPELQERPPPDRAPLVRTLDVRLTSVRLEVEAHGTVTPRTESKLVSEVSGPIIEVSPSFVSGGFFARDDVLVHVERVDYEAALETARASLARAESEHTRARKELERRRGLAARDAASAAQLDDAVLRERVTTAVRRAARAELARAERDLERTEIQAPFAGRVRDTQVDVGEFVSRGTAVASVYAVDYAEVRLPISSRDITALGLPAYHRGEGQGDGPPVVLSAELGGGRRTWHGHVVRTEGEIDPRSRMLNVVARIEDPYVLDADPARTPLPMGLFVDARILGREVDAVVVLPRPALRDGDRVLVIGPDDRLSIRDVDVLRIAGDQVVVASGLVRGERVCTSMLDVVIDGMRVRVADPAPAAAGPVP